MTTRWKLTLEYDGGPFQGWQRQSNGPSVQAVIEAALAVLDKRPVATRVAGRTDTGVHALGQVCHCDLDRPLSPDRLAAALNALMRPQPVAVLAAETVAADFDARRSAIGRAYRYRILNRRAPAVLAAGRAWHISRPLDLAAMAEAAPALIGHHDFTSFRAQGCQASGPMRTLDRLDVRREGETVVIEAGARSFLYHQVRNMVGSLVEIGLGKRPPGWLADVLAARNRALAGPTAPPHGLYFLSVAYPQPDSVATMRG